MIRANDLNQSNFSTSDERENLIIASSRSIRDIRNTEEILHKQIDDFQIIEKIRTVIQNLPKPTEKDISDLGLDTITKKSVYAILDTVPGNTNLQSIELVLHDFSDSMKKRAREEGKYAISITLNNGFIICHSTIGEETITPDWNIIPRMLDSDNVLRYVYFQKNNSKITVKFFEKFLSDGFVDWLGLKTRDTFYYFGGRYRFYAKLEDKITAILEIPEDRIDVWMDKHNEEISNGKVQFETPISTLSLEQILVGRKKYTNTEDFIQDYQGEKIGIERSKKFFSEIYSTTRQEKSVGPIEIFLNKFVDEKDKVVKIVENEHISVFEKENSKADILFCCDNIEIRPSYLDDIHTRFNNGIKIVLVHAGLPIAVRSFKIKNMQIGNKIIITPSIKFLNKYYKEAEIQDRWLDATFVSTIFLLLSESNANNHFKYFFNSFAKKILQEAHLIKRVTKIEDSVFEYKSSDLINGKDTVIIKNIEEVINEKTNNSPCKIIFFGIEKNGDFNPCLSQKFNDDRIYAITKELKDKIKKKIRIIPIRDQTKCVLMVIVDKNE